MHNVLIVDDDGGILRSYARVLSQAGFKVETASDGASALRAMGNSTFDVIVSDLNMPGMSGLILIDKIRLFDLDVPIVMITGWPSVDTAMKAIEHGALQYITKPIDSDTLVQAVQKAVKFGQIAKAKRQSFELVGGASHIVGDQAALSASFNRSLTTLYIAYQPIISWSTKTVFAYEALLRSREPSLPHPGAIIDAAERLGRVPDLCQIIRNKAIEPINQLKGNISIFLNLHPNSLTDDNLLSIDTPLSNVAGRIVLEITERASLHGINNVRARVAALRNIGFRVAIDDLGAGYAGLTSFSLLEPDIVKLDMALIRDLNKEPLKQTLVKTMTTMCKELGITVTSEGIETPEERNEVARAGCDLMQGFLFAKPNEAFPIPRF